MPKGTWPAGSGQRCTWFVRDSYGYVLFNPCLGLIGSWPTRERSQLAPWLDGDEYEASSKMWKGKCSESLIGIHIVFLLNCKWDLKTS